MTKLIHRVKETMLKVTYLVKGFQDSLGSVEHRKPRLLTILLYCALHKCMAQVLENFTFWT